ncbi:hypothetical protein FF38_00861 [Lucilia cuprina]|uniref:Uncharacterized protein n=1 Tax=Lucilia cuprina TaxID=7375 RepID=A0A0L0C206_LUCCU|nr:hypothetical protein CVS40_7753 [Lucilia cuprina]KNC26301.1 hypothetical protein FF38_00861 [Lucilia cuprina]
MGELFHMLLIKIVLLWLICLTVYSLAITTPMSNEINPTKAEKVYVHTSDLVLREKSGIPLIYHFITDYPHPHIPSNNYIKPWEVVASKPIRVKNLEGANSRILKKNNILYLAKSNESEENKINN